MQVTIAAAQYPITYHQNFYSWKAHVNEWAENAVQLGAQVLLFPEYGAMELVSIFEKEIQIDIRQQIVHLATVKDDFCAVWAEIAKKYSVVIIAPSIPVFHKGAPVNRVYVF